MLIQHQLVAHRLFKAKTRLYELQLRNVLHRLEFSRCVHASKNLHGDAGEFIIEDILQLGHAPMSEVMWGNLLDWHAQEQDGVCGIFP